MDEATKRFNAQLWEVRHLQFIGKHEDAVHTLERAVASFESDHHVAETMGAVLLLEMMRRYTGALVRLDDAREVLDPALPGMFWYTRGVLLSAVRRYDEAVASYQVAFVHPDEMDLRACLFFMGRAYRNAQRYTEAINSFTQALEFPGYMDDSALYFAIGYTEECAFRLLSETNPELLRWQFTGGTNYESVRRLTEKAVSAYQKVLEAADFPRPEEAWYRLGELYFARYEPQKAIHCYTQVIPAEIRESRGN